MIFTNILLALIAVLLLARVILQVRGVKKHFDKVYCAPSEVEHGVAFLSEEKFGNINDELYEWQLNGYELVCAQSNVVIDGDTGTMLYFTRKKIKNYYEE